MSDEQQTYHVWQCQACPDLFETESKAAMGEHLLAEHGIDVKEVPMVRQSTLHLDGSKGYENQWKLTFGDVVVFEVSGGTRKRSMG